MRLTFLGGAEEVGRSCIMVESEKARIILDAGVKIETSEYPQISEKADTHAGRRVHNARAPRPLGVHTAPVCKRVYRQDLHYEANNGAAERADCRLHKIIGAKRGDKGRARKDGEELQGPRLWQAIPDKGHDNRVHIRRPHTRQRAYICENEDKEHDIYRRHKPCEHKAARGRRPQEPDRRARSLQKARTEARTTSSRTKRTWQGPW